MDFCYGGDVLGMWRWQCNIKFERKEGNRRLKRSTKVLFHIRDVILHSFAIFDFVVFLYFMYLPTLVGFTSQNTTRKNAVVFPRNFVPLQRKITRAVAQDGVVHASLCSAIQFTYYQKSIIDETHWANVVL